LSGMVEEGTEKRERERERTTSSKMAVEEKEHTEGQKWRPKEFSEEAGCKLPFTTTKTPSRVILSCLLYCTSLRPLIVPVCNQATYHHSDNKRRMFLTSLAAFTAKVCTGTRDEPTTLKCGYTAVASNNKFPLR